MSSVAAPERPAHPAVEHLRRFARAALGADREAFLESFGIAPLRPGEVPELTPDVDEHQLLDRALSAGCVRIGAAVFPVRTDPRWSYRNAAGSYVCRGIRVGRNLALFEHRGDPSDDCSDADLAGLAAASRALLGADTEVSWLVIDDLRRVARLSRSSRIRCLERLADLRGRVAVHGFIAPMPLAALLELPRDAKGATRCVDRSLRALLLGMSTTIDPGADVAEPGPESDVIAWLLAAATRGVLRVHESSRRIVTQSTWRDRDAQCRWAVFQMAPSVVIAVVEGSVSAAHVRALGGALVAAATAGDHARATFVVDLRRAELVGWNTRGEVLRLVRSLTPCRGQSMVLAGESLVRFVGLTAAMVGARDVSVQTRGRLVDVLADALDPRWRRASLPPAPTSGRIPGEVDALRAEERALRHALARERAERDDVHRAVLGAIGRIAWEHDGPALSLPTTTDPIVAEIYAAFEILDRDVREMNRSLVRDASQLEEKVRERTAELERARDAAERGAMMRQHFLATVSHEIRTPLNGIIGAARLLADHSPRPDQRGSLDVLGAASSHLLALVNGLLDLSRMDAQALDLTREPFDVRAVVREVTSTFSARAQEKGIGFEVTVSDAVPRSVVGDRLRLSQMLYNLVGNAVKFTTRGVVSLSLDARRAGADVELLCVVRDSGRGIAATHLPTLFELFSAASRATSSAYGGTGLGLAITRRLARLHGGDVTVDSAPGVGSVFTVSVRVGASSEPARDDATSTPDAPLDLAGLRVLVVDDNRLNLFVASRLLEGWNARVTTADDGAEAVEAVRRGAFDVVLMDLHMPNVDGWEAAARVRALACPTARTTPIIALSADVSSDARTRAAALAISDFATKPFDPDDLFARIARVARRAPQRD